MAVTSFVIQTNTTFSYQTHLPGEWIKLTPSSVDSVTIESNSTERVVREKIEAQIITYIPDLKLSATNYLEILRSEYHQVRSGSAWIDRDKARKYIVGGGFNPQPSYREFWEDRQK